MDIRYAQDADVPLLMEHDKHISKREMEHAVALGRIYIAQENGQFVGWLRYNLFWDNIPFMNLLYIMDEVQGKGFGRQLVDFWENEMRQLGFKQVLTSTQSNEYAQHFYFKIGYQAVGGFRLDGDFYEVIFTKCLT